MLYDVSDKELGIVIIRTDMDTAQGADPWYSGDTGFLTTFLPGTMLGGIVETNAGGMSFIPYNSISTAPTDFSQLDAHVRNPTFGNLTGWNIYYYPHVGFIAAPYSPTPAVDADVWSSAKITNLRAHIRRLADHLTDDRGIRGMKMIIGHHNGDLSPTTVCVNANLATQKSTAIARYVQIDSAVWQELRGTSAPFSHHCVVCPTILSQEGARADTNTTFYRAMDYATYNNGEFLKYCDAWDVSFAHRGMAYEDGASGLIGTDPPANVGSFLNVWRALKAAKTAYGAGAPNIPIVSLISTVGSQASQYIGTPSGEWTTDDTTLNGKMLLEAYRLGLQQNGMFLWSIAVSGGQAIAFMPDELGATGTELERTRGVNGTINLYYVSGTNTLSPHTIAQNTFLLVSDMRRYRLPVGGDLSIPEKTWSYNAANPDNGYHLPYSWAVCAKAYNAPVSTAINVAPWREWSEVQLTGGEIISSPGLPKMICRPVLLPKFVDWKVTCFAQCTLGGIAQLCVKGFDLTDGEAVVRSEVAPDAYGDPLEITFRPVGHNTRLPNPARAVIVCYHNGVGEARFKNVNMDISPPPFTVEPPLAACVSSTSNLFLNPFSSATACKRPLGTGALYANDSAAMTLAWNANISGAAVNVALPSTGIGIGLWDVSSTTGTFSTSITVDTGKAGADASMFPVTIRLPNNFSQTMNGPDTTDQISCFWDGTNYHDFFGLRTVTAGSAYKARTHYVHAGGGQGHGGPIRSSSASAMWLEAMIVRGNEWNTVDSRCEHALAISLGSKATHYAAQLGPTFVWPAISGALDAANTGIIPYGQLFAIPPPEKGGPDPLTLGLGTTSDTLAWRLYYVLLWRGIFVTDQATVATIRCDQALSAAARTDFLDAIHILYPLCRAVTNVGTG